MGDEQAETYLRLLAEAETRRARRGPSGPGGPDGPHGSGPGSGPGWARSLEQVRWAGDVLITAGLLTPEDVGRVTTELEVALLARSDQDQPRYAQRAGWVFSSRASHAPPASPRQAPAPPAGMVPVGRRISVAHDRAPSDLYLMTLVRSPDRVAITAAMRMHWPADGSSADLEITGAGPQHLPYDQLWAADDRGTRYRIGMSGEGGTLTWQGALTLDRGLPPQARWLDLVADGPRRLARIDLSGPQEIRPAATTEPDPAAPPGERLLAAAAERLLAGAWDPSGPRAQARLGETIAVLAGAGALAADSPAPGHLAALCQRLGVSGHGITVPAAGQIPARWAEVLPPRSDGPPVPEWFVPTGPAAVDADGARFALAGLASVGGRTFLHVVAGGRPPYGHRSWWVRDGAGHWHLATETDPDVLADAAGLTVAFRLRLTPPLRARPEAIEVEVTGRHGSVRTVVPVGAAPAGAGPAGAGPAGAGPAGVGPDMPDT